MDRESQWVVLWICIKLIITYQLRFFLNHVHELLGAHLLNESKRINERVSEVPRRQSQIADHTLGTLRPAFHGTVTRSGGRAAGREPHLDPVPVFFSGSEAAVSCGRREAVQQLLRSGKS